MVSIRAVTGIFENKSACLVVNPIRVGSFPICTRAGGT